MKSNFYLERFGQRYCIRLNEGLNLVGRLSDSTVKISGSIGSRNHCQITVKEDIVILTDFSTNGTYINENEYKDTTVILKENDKIGIGVFNVDDLLDKDDEYHVYRLRKIRPIFNNIAIDELTNKKDVIEISDEEDYEIIPSLEEDLSAEKPNLNYSRQEGNESAVAECSKEKCNKESTANSLNQLKLEKDKVNNITRADNGPNKIHENDTARGRATKEKSKAEMENNFLDFQSDELSQAFWDDVKQEIAELEISELSSNDDDLASTKNIELPIIDILDLTLDDDALKNEEEDDDDDIDITTRQWYMKLSQNFDESYEKKARSDVFDEVLERTNKNEEIIGDQLRKDTSIPEKGPVESLYTDRKESSKKDNVQNKIAENSATEFAKHIPEDTKRRNSILIIDAPSLPTKKGKLRGVSADLSRKSNVNIEKTPSKKMQTQSPKKHLRSHYANPEAQNSKLYRKWMEKPNARKEKSRAKQIKDKRKEKLKELAEKKSIEKLKDLEPQKKASEKRKHSSSLDDLGEDEKNKALKKAKVKFTEKNRGAFLTELPSVPTNKVTNHRKSIDLTSAAQGSFSSALVSSDTKLLHSSNNKGKKEKSDNKYSLEIEQSNSHMTSNENFTNSKKQKELRPSKCSEIPHRNKIFKSCLKLVDNIIFQTNGKKKSVRFNPEPIVHTFVREMETEENIDQNALKQLNTKDMMQPDLSDFEGRKRFWRLKCPPKLVCSTDSILSDILSWKPEWFNDENVNINGCNTLIPMIHSFKTSEDYQKIVFPLMKLEFWERLVKDKNNYSGKFIELNLRKFEVEEKISKKKIVYHCTYSSSFPLNKPQFYVSELVVIKISDKQLIFGFIRVNQCLNPTTPLSFKNYNIQIESNMYLNYSYDLRNLKVISVQKISVIATELGAFEAVQNLAYSPLVKKILNPGLLTQNDNIPESKLKEFKYNGYDKLNDIQQNILMQTYVRSINPIKENITLIEGPPGTGKSKLITNLILQLLYGHDLRTLDRKILICAQSNTAVDVVALMLIKIRQKMDSKRFRLVRYGVLDKMHPEVKPYSLIELIKLQKRSKVQNSNMAPLVEEKNLLEQKIKKLEMTKNSNNRDVMDLDKAKKDLNQIKDLLGENEIDKNLEYKFLAHANVVCTTLSSCVRLLKLCNFFDVCIIDEATQCNEPWTLVPLQFGINSLILIGDTQQLPATTLSYLSKSYNFGKSYFTRAKELMEDTKQSIIMKLKVQYRMHPEISKWPNSYFYRNHLTNSETTTKFKPLVKPYTVIELNFSQNKIITNGKIANCSEADFVVKLIQGLSDIMSTKQFSYGIITPYTLHCQNLREKLRKEKLEIEVNTIDSYQGKEKDVIIISNARTEGIGFLNEICRLNVALTRARKCLILCGNFQQLTNVNVWKSLISDAKRRNKYIEPKESDLNDFKNKIIERLKL